MIYIAHIRENNETQSVKDHNLKTAASAKELCDIDGLKTSAYLAGILHDAGKISDEFQEYIRRAKEDPSSVYRGQVTHSTSGGCLISELSDKPVSPGYFAVELIREAIISHHGLYDCMDHEGTISFERRAQKETGLEAIRNEVFTYIPREELTELFRQAVSELNGLVDKIIALIKSDRGGKLGNRLFYFGMCERMLLSLLVDADRTDTACFMNGTPAVQGRTKEQLTEIWDGLSEHLEKKIGEFEAKKEIDFYRAEISKTCLEAAKESSGIYRLVVPTGAGKTLASLRYAVNHAKQYGKKHIFYIAPYNSILEQNADAIRKALGDNEIILEHHCNIVEEEEGGNERYKELTENWDLPIVVTTFVQFLNTLFSSKMSSVRRMHALSDSVIIIDEIQSLPVKCVSLFNLAINFLTKICNTTVVLCSATQPLLDVIDKNFLIKPTDMIIHEQKYFKAFKRTEIVDETDKKQGGFNINELSDFVLSKLKGSNSILVIVNTKSCARNLYTRLSEICSDTAEEIKLFHLSTNMCAAHRKDVLDSIRDFDKTKKMVCVSTQLIEAGVDISFETVIRSLAGLDSIVQAAGRCNRNGERKCGTVHIVKISEEDISRLVDIRKAQEAMGTVLYTYSSCPKIYDNDLLSKKAMDQYYTAYFMNRQGEMDYNLPELDTTIVELLSDNGIGTDHYVYKNHEKPKLIMKQAFKSAGDHFEVIPEKGMKDIVVEYNEESGELIAMLNSDIKADEQKLLLKKLQKYTVSISEQMFQKLKDALFILKNVGVTVLKREYYSKETGVAETPVRKMSFLNQ